ncbi:MAG: hypothetical protein BWY09_02641 [Candidatus Hydrogenedentes bacterium ADurb.Bin179]|nr:MAG: hypothetical protein BWY09_02641 [Candidatus Hydrogenedentes bacterium ADurb.Bin179]
MHSKRGKRNGGNDARYYDEVRRNGFDGLILKNTMRLTLGDIYALLESACLCIFLRLSQSLVYERFF